MRSVWSTVLVGGLLAVGCGGKALYVDGGDGSGGDGGQSTTGAGGSNVAGSTGVGGVGGGGRSGSGGASAVGGSSVGGQATGGSAVGGASLGGASTGVGGAAGASLGGAAGFGVGGQGVAGAGMAGFGGTCPPGIASACRCPDGRIGYQICEPDGIYGPCDCGLTAPELLEWYREAILGDWFGFRYSVWDGEIEVSMTFMPMTYDVACGGVGCSSLYWGIEGSSPLRVWALNDIRADGRATGTLAILFEDNTTQGELDNLWISDDALILEFDLWPEGRDVAAPVHFILYRL